MSFDEIEELDCPHGNKMVRKHNNGVSMGIPKCCMEERESPAKGEGFVIQDKKIFHSIMGGSVFVDKK